MVLDAGPHSPPSGVVIRLEGFHLLLSFMGSIGVIMAGSGLEEMWETVYAKNSVVHMMNGRTYARGSRAHFISQSALATQLLVSSTVDDSLKKDVETCFVYLLDNSATLEDIEHSDALHDIDDFLSTRLADVCSSGRTEKLLVQCFKPASDCSSEQNGVVIATITLNMDSVIPPFWKNPPPDVLGLLGQ